MWYILCTAKVVTGGDVHCVHTALCVCVCIYIYIYIIFFSSPPRQFETEIGLVHQFQFSSTLQRMSVITRTLGSQDFVLYCKGSPEMIVSLSRPETGEAIIQQMIVSLSRPETGEAIIQQWENLVHQVTSKRPGHTCKIHGHTKIDKFVGQIKTRGSL